MADTKKVIIFGLIGTQILVDGKVDVGGNTSSGDGSSFMTNKFCVK